MTWREELEQAVPNWYQITSRFVIASFWPLTELIARHYHYGDPIPPGELALGPTSLLLVFISCAYFGMGMADITHRLHLKRVLRSLGSQQVSA